jgi:hypothetical protein
MSIETGSLLTHGNAVMIICCRILFPLIVCQLYLVLYILLYRWIISIKSACYVNND